MVASVVGRCYTTATWSSAAISVMGLISGGRIQIWTIGTKILRTVPLTTNVAGQRACGCPRGSVAMPVGTPRWMSGVDVSSSPAAQLAHGD